MKPNRKVGTLQKKYRSVPVGVRRYLFRPYLKPAKLYLITTAGVFPLAPGSWNKAGLLKRGYAVNTTLTHKNQVVLERRIRT